MSSYDYEKTSGAVMPMIEQHIDHHDPSNDKLLLTALSAVSKSTNRRTSCSSACQTGPVVVEVKSIMGELGSSNKRMMLVRLRRWFSFQVSPG